MHTVIVVVEGLTRGYGSGIGSEGAVWGGAARGEGFGVEFRGGVVPYEDAGLVLRSVLAVCALMRG